MTDPSEFVVKMDSKVLDDFCLGNVLLLRIMKGRAETKDNSFMRRFVRINFNSPHVKPVFKFIKVSLECRRGYG